MIPEVFTIGRFCRIADGPDEVHKVRVAKKILERVASKGGE